MSSKLKTWAIIIVLALVIGGAAIALFLQNTAPSKLDDFAKCINNKGALFYGAFWCPHCQDEKKLFGSSAKYLPYIECSTPDSNGQLQVCKDEKITVYPTWRFVDGTTKEGELSLQELADLTACQLPQ